MRSLKSGAVETCDIFLPFTNHSPMGLFFRPGLTHGTLKRGNQWFGFPPHFRKTYGKTPISRWFAFFILFLLLIWRFPEIGVRPKSSIYRWIFHYKPSSYWGILHPTRNSQGASMWSRLRNNAFSSFSASLPQGRVDPCYFWTLTLWQTNSLLLKMAIYSLFTYETWWFSIVMWQFTRG